MNLYDEASAIALFLGHSLYCGNWATNIICYTHNTN